MTLFGPASRASLLSTGVWWRFTVAVMLALLVPAGGSSSTTTTAFLFPTSTAAMRPRRPLPVSSSSSSSSDEVERLRQSASKLRKEAESLRQKLDKDGIRSSRADSMDAATLEQPRGATRTPPLKAAPPSYTSLNDSTWTLTYRFSNQATSIQADNNNNNDNKNDSDSNEKNTLPRVNYSGRLTLTFRADGYTDLISHEPIGNSLLQITKVWGWNEEEEEEASLSSPSPVSFSSKSNKEQTSGNDDDNGRGEQRYLLFSMSTTTTTPTMNSEDNKKNSRRDDEEQRYYWQARIDTNRRGNQEVISLDDGTVTIKENVRPPGGFWGIFDGGGILAQFRQVGNFGGKPTSVEEASTV